MIPILRNKSLFYPIYKASKLDCVFYTPCISRVWVVLRIFVRAASRRKARYITLLPYELLTPCKTANHITCEAFHPRWYVCDFYFLLCLLATLVIRTITLPSIAKVDDSRCGKSRFSGRRSDISFVAQNLRHYFCQDRKASGAKYKWRGEANMSWRRTRGF